MASFPVTPDPLAAPFICGFDGTVHESLEALHEYFKRWRLARAKYYQTYYPRKDPITGELIPFKDLEQYLEQDFANKNTLKAWLKANPKEGFEWSKNWLRNRRASKGLTYAPSQTELRTLCCPTMPYYDKVGAKEGGYYGITESIGYAQRYNNDAPSYRSLHPDVTIIQDSREQIPIKLDAKTVEGTINVGDYALSEPYDFGLRIERKGLSDWCGTMSGKKVARKGGKKGTGAHEDSSLQRFERELDRAVGAGLYVVMIVESNINDAQSIGYLPQTKWVKASPSYLMHNLRGLLVKYPLHFQCLFVNGRAEMARVMLKIFEMGQQVKTCDLQYAYEEGRL